MSGVAPLHNSVYAELMNITEARFHSVKSASTEELQRRVAAGYNTTSTHRQAQARLAGAELKKRGVSA